MRLQTKIVVTTLTVLIISLMFLGILVFSNSKMNLELQVVNQLQSISQIQKDKITRFLQDQENKLELIATQNSLSNEELNQMVHIDNSFYNLFVINSGGVVVASSNELDIGNDESKDAYFINGKNQTYVGRVYLSEDTDRYSIPVATPFHDSVLVGRIDLAYFDILVSDRTGLGETGENLLAFNSENKTVVYFSQRRFSDVGMEILTEEEIQTRAIAPALRKEEIVSTNARDYRNVTVISSTRYIDGVDIGMVTKLDVLEAFSKTKDLQKFTIFVVIITSLLLGFIISIISKNVSLDVNRITYDINEITKGNLEIQLKQSSIFEIQSLVDSLNRILASLKLAILRTGMAKEEIGIGEAIKAEEAAIKAKEVAERRFRLLYETSRDAIMVVEPPTWNFTSANPATIKLFNVKNEKEFASLGPGDLSPRKQPDGQLSSVKAKKMIQKAMKEGSNFFEWMHKRYKGEEFPATVLLSRVEENGKKYLQATVRNISELKEAEKEIKRLREARNIEKEKKMKRREVKVGFREVDVGEREKLVKKRESNFPRKGTKVNLGKKRI